MMQEWKRGNFKWANGQQSCVKRRAELSLKLNPKCTDRVSCHFRKGAEALAEYGGL